MKRKRLVALFLALTLLLSLASCAKGTEKPDGDVLTVVSNGTAVCRVIFAADGGINLRAYGNTLVRAVNKLTGVTLENLPDTGEENAEEILVGRTNRTLSNEAYTALRGKTNSFLILARDGKIAIAATDDDMLLNAIDFFTSAAKDALGATVGEGLFTLPASLEYLRTPGSAAEPAELLGTGAPFSLVSAWDHAIAADGEYRELSAACTDGAFLYLALTASSGKTRVVKVDLSNGKTVSKTDVSDVIGVRSMCYHSLSGTVLLLDDKTGKTVTRLTADTLAQYDTLTFPDELAALSYEGNSCRYVGALPSGEIRWYDLSRVKTGEPIAAVNAAGISPKPNVTFADVDCDSRFLYLLYDGTTDGTDREAYLVTIDTLSGARNVHTLPTDETNTFPATALCHVGRTFFTAFEMPEAGGCVHRTVLASLRSLGEPFEVFTPVITEHIDTSYVTSQKLFDIYTVSGISTDDSLKKRNNVLQGGCSDGRYGYFCMEYQGGSGNYSNTETHDTVIVKVDLTNNNFVAKSAPLKLDHSNDATYNARRGVILVAHNGKQANKLSEIDPETLTVVGEITLPFNIFSIAYCERTNRYVVGRSGGRDFAVLDADFNVVVDRFDAGDSAVYCDKTQLLTQGADCDSRYIYFVQSGKNDGENWTNYLVVYDWSGALAFVKILPSLTLESENVFHVGQTLYVSCNGGSEPCYRIDFSAL